MKKLPISKSVFKEIRNEDLCYVDKSPFVKQLLDDHSKYWFLSRPRRFGKSLMLSMIAAYYDILYKDRFEELFGDKAIYQHPTEERGKYLVLTLNFSLVETEGNKTEASFVNHIRDLAVDFIRRYNDLLSAQ